MSRGHILSMTVSTPDGFFVGLVDTGRVRVGQLGGTCYEFPVIHHKAHEAMALTGHTVRAFHSACGSVPFQYSMTHHAAKGYCLPLFHALDSVDIVAIDGVELLPRYRELSPSRRLIRLPNDEELTVDDQTVRILGGSATERAPDDAAVDSMLA